MTREVTLDIGSLELDKAALRVVYRGIACLASNEPDLLTNIAFDGSTLRLTGVTDNGDRVLTKLGSYLRNPPLQKQLESLLEGESIWA